MPTKPTKATARRQREAAARIHHQAAQPSFPGNSLYAQLFAERLEEDATASLSDPDTDEAPPPHGS